MLDLGRYSAVVTLQYGDEAKRNISATTYFWVVPAKPVAIALGLITSFLLIITWFIRRYIRRALALEQHRLGVSPQDQLARKETVPTVAVLLEPLKEGAVDLRRLTQQETTSATAVATATTLYQTERTSAPVTFGQFLRKYRSFFVFIFLVAVALFGSIWYFSRVLVQSRAYQISDVKVQQETPTPVPTQP